MAFLTIAGVEYLVVEGSADADEPETLGTPKLRTFSGLLRSTVRAEYVNATCTLIASVAQLAALRAAISAAVIIDVGGDWLGAMRAQVRILQASPETTFPLNVPTLEYKVRVSITQAAAGQ